LDTSRLTKILEGTLLTTFRLFCDTLQVPCIDRSAVVIPYFVEHKCLTL